MVPRFSLPWKRTLDVHASCGAHASGLGAESMGTANTRREKSLLINRMTYARKHISRNGKKKKEKKSYILVWKYIPMQLGKWESGEVSWILISRFTSIAIAHSDYKYIDISNYPTAQTAKSERGAQRPKGTSVPIELHGPKTKS